MLEKKITIKKSDVMCWKKYCQKQKLTICCIVLEKKYQVVDVKKNILSKYIVLEIISGVEISNKQTIIYE